MALKPERPSLVVLPGGRDVEGQDPYDFDPRFERELVLLLCTSRSFWELFGVKLNPGLLGHKLAKLVVETCQLLYQETQKPPGGLSILYQRLTERRKAGQIEQADVDAIVDWVEDCLDAGLPEEVAVVERVTTVLKKDFLRRFVDQAIDQLKPGGGDVDQLQRSLVEISELGVQEEGRSIVVNTRASWEAIYEQQGIKRHTTGIAELDVELSGGINEGGLFVWLADPGFGKSMACSQTFGMGLREGSSVIYISAELPAGEVSARVKAQMTGFSLPYIRDPKRQDVRQEAEYRIARMTEKSGGFGVIRAIPGGAITIHQVLEMVRREEDKAKRQFRVVIVDPLDRVVAGGGGDDGGYQTGLAVYNTFRNFLLEEKRYGITACQPLRKSSSNKDKRPVIDLHHMADSMHKPRIADIVVSINPLEEGGYDLFVAKHRTGRSRGTVGPLLPDFEHGRMIRESTREGLL